MAHGENWPVGSIIEHFEEKLRITFNSGACGSVEYLDGTSASNRWYWEYGGVKAKLISQPESEKKQRT